MPKTISSVVLWSKMGSGFTSTWDDVLELGKRRDGSLRLRLGRVGLDDPGTIVMYRSGTFRTGERFVRELQTLHEKESVVGNPEPLSLGDVLSAIRAVVDFDPKLAKAALLVLKAELEDTPMQRAG